MKEVLMWHTAKIYLLLLPVLFVLDYLWLGVLMSGFYKKELGPFLRLSGDALAPIPWAAIVVYLAIPLGVVLFALPRVSRENLLTSSLFWGFMYGVILYAVYDMTNYSLLKGWPLKVSLVDICWGGVLNASATYAAALLDRWMK
jgi:uncharacterized membrane protein